MRGEDVDVDAPSAAANGNGSLEAEVPDWSPASWRTKPIKQDVVYVDQRALQTARAELQRKPPLVTPGEICKLKSSLREVALGKAFLLQGGDCAELFEYCTAKSIEAKMKLLLQMSLVLIYEGYKPVVRVGRMAGQYAKPRSNPFETVDGKRIPSFRGDILNGYELDKRDIDPARLVLAYNHSAATLNHVRGQLASGFADLHHPSAWDLGHIKDSALKAKYGDIVDRVTGALRLLRTVGVETSKLETADLYSSHEGLLLEYEESLTRLLPHPARYEPGTRPVRSSAEDSSGWYNTSGHFLWIGDRTRQVNGAHVEFFRGIENPIGVKVGPSMTALELVEMMQTLNPRKEIGKVTLITRYGASKVRSTLPSHISAVRQSGHVPVWQCDPMHGNTFTTATASAYKSRKFTDILAELTETSLVHKEMGSYLGGVHLELTGESVTECVGGSEGLVEEDLDLNYTTFCDPRLNEKQALEMAFLLAAHMKEGNKEKAV